ncbi:MAG: hypothetical protein ACJ79C_09675 [Myxococcales bacterium]
MKAARRHRETDDMRPEYDFSAGVRGKYAARFAQGSKIVVLAPDVAQVFRTARAVNAALRREIRKASHRKPRRRPLR